MANITPNTKEEQDAAYSPEEQARRSAQSLHDAEQQGFENPNHISKSEAPGDLSGGVRQAEENPSAPSTGGSYVSNFTGKHAKELSKKLSKSFLKRRGPLLAIGGLSLGGLALVLIVPSLLLFNLLANMFTTYNPSAAALTQVTKLMILNKLGANGATVGACSIVTIACQFRTPSNELLRQLESEDIVALGADKKPMVIDPDAKWPTERPEYFSVGEGEDAFIVAAKDLTSALQSNTEFRLAFNRVVKRVGVRAFSRLSPAFLAVIEKFRLKLNDVLGQGTENTNTGEHSVADALSEDFQLTGADGEAVEGAGEVASTVVSDLSLRISNLLTLVGKASKGSGVVLAMAFQCMADEVPGMIQKTMTSMQQATAVSVAQPVVTAMSAAQAGDDSNNPSAVSQLANEWEQDGSNGKSALDSIGVRYGNYGDTDTSSDPTYQNVTPAAFGSSISDLEIANGILNNPASQTECALLMNPVSGSAIAAGINAVVAGASAPTFGTAYALNLIISATATAAINQFGTQIASGISNLVAPGLGALVQPTLNKMNQPGETFGNVVTYGLGTIFENTGAQTFGTAMTTDQLPAYSAQIQNQELADAELDRATLSPFDPSSPYTFLGSIVNQFMPYYSSFSSIAGSLSVLGDLLPISFGSILNTSTAGALSGNTPSIYSDACPQPVTAVNGKPLAADIFCNTVYGIVVPNNWDPNETADLMTSMQTDGVNEIDPNTGAPVVDNDVLSQTINSITNVSGSTTNVTPDISYADWLSTCTDPDNDTECTGDNTTENTYGLYNAELTVNSMLDEDEATTST